ncbi:MAG: winged helix-turn-helix transcriptional regulator [Chloracidobacterium sp.]|nr:winged helix-turn-helix transcriptional regulator [Chloracidobacterium sp.]
MQESTFTALEHLFLALSDKTRLRLLALMVDGDVPVGVLADSLGESQPKISRHLAYLRSAGLVSTRREGKWIYYGIENEMDDAVTRVYSMQRFARSCRTEVSGPDRSASRWSLNSILTKRVNMKMTNMCLIGSRKN